MQELDDDFILRRAAISDQEKIWEILQQAIQRRKNDGSNQWQDGYPNSETAIIDIQNKVGFVLEKNNEIAGYAAIIFDVEPAYENIEGKWLSEGEYAVIHRVAISEKFLGQGIATELFLKIEDFVKSNQVMSIKVDTNFDNIQMLKILDKLEYSYCGEVHFRGSPRKAFEKILT
ncbi:GNAT family N-acetyltransferase [Kaistella jeonii]|uniref:GCN5 family acetyltransferase n=1 Tax=Kaistella jeonii TaxID=266749 RepID=A0A0C1FR53_9FLAO|nr:GNAT family N-acetyltransferase [Kaistella jeonii]KIA90379.1 GCN5 family acetyltransferase [Kaistella jeonii]SFB73737.1 Acetyltransferase (GNAT) family protein [Kaistella jeonii]VEI95071.1 Acetyltransferase (GNAT) family [Kaistella jeonii]